MARMDVSTFCIVAGASRGIGREAAIQLSQKFGPNSKLCLIARNKSLLEETAGLVKGKCGDNVTVKCISADLGNEEGISTLNKSIYESVGDPSRFQHAIIIHNAASVGQMSKYAREMDDVAYLQKFNMLSLTGAIVMTSEFFKVFGHGDGSTRKTVVQLTSDNATIPYKTMHIYCMVKAARDMFFRVMALEEPEVRVMSYDPGAVDTDMYKEASASADIGVSSELQELTKQSYFLTPEQSAGALVRAIEGNQYESGSVVRCYDVLGIKIQ